MTGVTSIRTALTDLLEIEHPVMLAGMGGVSYHALVGAVSEAGGFGCLGASTMRPEEIVAEIRGVRSRTSKPFGVDLLTALPDEMMTNVENLIREGASVFVAGLGVPRDAIELVVGDSRGLAAEQRRDGLGTGAVEEGVDEMAERRPPCGMTRHRWNVDEAQAMLFVAHVPLAFQHPQLRPHRGIARCAVEPLADRRRRRPPELVEHVHDLSLPLGQELWRAQRHVSFVTLLRL